MDRNASNQPPLSTRGMAADESSSQLDATRPVDVADTSQDGMVARRGSMSSLPIGIRRASAGVGPRSDIGEMRQLLSAFANQVADSSALITSAMTMLANTVANQERLTAFLLVTTQQGGLAGDAATGVNIVVQPSRVAEDVAPTVNTDVAAAIDAARGNASADVQHARTAAEVTNVASVPPTTPLRDPTSANASPDFVVSWKQCPFALTEKGCLRLHTAEYFSAWASLPPGFLSEVPSLRRTAAGAGASQ